MERNRNTNLAARAGSWSARHKKRAILGWLAFVAIALVLGSAVGTNTIKDEDQGAGEAARADRIINESFSSSAEESVLIQTKGRDRAALQSGVRDVQSALGRFDTVRLEREVVYSQDGRSALVKFELPGDDEVAHEKQIEPIMAALGKTAGRHDGLTVGQFGDASASKALNERFEEDFQKAESLSVPVTLIILVFAFGALVAAGLPVLLALSAVGAAIGLTGLVSQVMPVDENISSVILLIGMAVGVDYSLFYLRREREEREKGADALSAIDAAAATSGRAVLVSGLTVMIAMAGMFLTGHGTFMSFAVGTMLVVAVAMIGSLTVLPAMLAALGPKVDKGRVPFMRRLRRADGESRMWNAVLDRVLRRPGVALVAASAVLIALAIPAFGMKTANSGADDLPRDLEVMQVYDRMQAAFPGGQIPAEVAVKAEDVTAPAVRSAIADLQRQALATGTMEKPTNLAVSPDRTVALLSIPVRGTGTDATSESALASLREDIIPRTVERAPGVDDVAVAGMTAGSKDFNDLMKSTAPLVFAFVLSLAFLLLLVTFRSIVIPAKAIVLNLLSVAAAYGVLVLVFQEGIGAELLGVDESSQGAITSWLPMFLFVILFGLSMDYHVFILSRIREAFDRGMSTEDAVAHGIKSTAGVVTSAAIVMVAVFAIFGTLSFIDMKQMGVGLAAAVLIDATIVRAVLLPAAMKLLGDWNWYLPRGLARRLPQPAGAHA
jgi:RND superfamily putative drug exporter